MMIVKKRHNSVGMLPLENAREMSPALRRDLALLAMFARRCASPSVHDGVFSLQN